MQLQHYKSICFKASFLLIALWLPFCNSCIYAQGEGTINGKIITTEEKPLEGCLVTLSNYRSNSLVKSAFTDSLGYYLFSDLQADTFRLTVALNGYNSLEKDTVIINATNRSAALNDIILTQKENLLSEVTVTGTIPFIERKIDRTIINPEAQITNAGSNILDVLAKAPGVQVSQNGGISLKGKPGVVILVDDKPTYLSGTELQAYLKTITTAEVKQIEIIPNPPAKYDAEGNAGV
ncbi:MAG: carboxypeptidase regulatory-like domain-containing protein, partial [Chitinophagales bacterium]|nr:carboxypeptidase regulatory-like domain-containing protein [Chitinophagales bacterium]